MFARALRSIHLLTAAFVLITAACVTNTEAVTGSGTLAGETREASGFSRIDLRTVGDVTIVQTGADSVVISAEDNLLPLLLTSVRGGWLVIETPSGKSLRPTRALNITVTVAALDELTLSGAGTFHVDDVQSDSLAVTLSGAGSITVTGAIGRQTVLVSGAGSYDASGVDGLDAEVTVSGTGHAVLNVSGTLNAMLSGAGNIVYSGNPSVTRTVTGVGNIVSR